MSRRTYLRVLAPAIALIAILALTIGTAGAWSPLNRPAGGLPPHGYGTCTHTLTYPNADTVKVTSTAYVGGGCTVQVAFRCLYNDTAWMQGPTVPGGQTRQQTFGPACPAGQAQYVFLRELYPFGQLNFFTCSGCNSWYWT